MRVAVLTVGLGRIRLWLDGRPAPRVMAGPDWPSEVRRAMMRAQRTMPSSTCLARSLAAEYLLRSAGHQAALTIGVARGTLGDPPLDAHAWVECGGVVIAGDGELDRYAALLRYGSTG